MFVDKKKFLSLLKEDSLEFSKLIDLTMRFFRLSESQLARQFGVSPSTVGRWVEKEATPHLLKLQYVKKKINAMVLNMKDGVQFEV